MPKQKFRIGDLVHHPISKKIVPISGLFLTKIRFFKVKKFGKRTETWMYNLGGEEFFAQENLVSATPCPSCKYPSWDWASGCPMCGLSPEDGE